MNQWLFKFSGGRTEKSMSDIHAEQIEAFSELMSRVTDNAEELLIENKKQIEEYSALKTEEFKSTLQELEDTMAKYIPDTTSWNGMKSYRESMNICPKELNNIQPPNVIEKIWELFKIKVTENNHTNDIDDFSASI